YTRATVRTFYRQLRQYGQLRRQVVGMNIQTITHDMGKALKLPRDYGLIVSDVAPGGPAETEGLKIGDILISIDGQPAENLPTVNYNFRLRDSTENVQMVVLRGGTQRTLSIAPVESRSRFDSVSEMVDPEKHLVPELGLLGVEIDSQIAAKVDGLRAPYGVIVVAPTAGTTAKCPPPPPA